MEADLLMRPYTISGKLKNNNERQKSIPLPKEHQRVLKSF
jgi:hypothetical protein